ncbi:YbhB/YbcL family Raf kinase inhibitor-like protein [Ruania albidiflava]|uniref:YbhB/YbcL family Raf kinase inhibitor-like protein n=1 Tax=Ruania albidiflava TaxID=366586 RepID=UPI00040DCC50
MSLTSSDLTDGARLDPRHAAAGENVSPQLSWSGAPEGTQGYLLSCFDPDAPTPSGYWHWTVVDLDSAATSLDRGEGQSDISLPGAAFHLKSDGGAFAYEGAAPPAGDTEHRYVFTIHALDVPTLELEPEDSPAKAHFTGLFHALARGVLTVTYQL